MKHVPAFAFAFLTIGALSPMAQDLPPGLSSASLLPGWTDQDGNRVAALELRLEPGWKTYWRSPGDSGLPPSFDWKGSTNLAGITLHWPAPQAISSGGDLSLGYHDRLVLPFTAHAADSATPITLQAAVDFGLCENICVPAHVVLQSAPAADSPDPVIQDALTQAPQLLDTRPVCHLTSIDDGMRLSAVLPEDDRTQAAAMELVDRPEVWVSQPVLTQDGGGVRATADFVAPSGAPFDLHPEKVRITLVRADGAVEMQGCDLQD